MKIVHCLASALLVAGCSHRVLESTAEPSVEQTSETTAPPEYRSKTSAASAVVAGTPVLVFHQICATTCTTADTYGVSQDEFDRILSVLDARGYTTISMADFARAHGGDTANLPRRPVLVTFDDGRQDAYVGADPVLARHGMQATMFVITNKVGAAPSFFMSWPEVHGAVSSGRWNMQVHAHAGHVQIPVATDARGALVGGSFYANVSCEDPACGSYETHAEWHTRTVTDLEMADGVLATELGGLYTSHSFAVPFNDYGQVRTNDPLVPEELRAYFDAHYDVWFTQDADAAFMTPSKETHEVQRFMLTNELTSVDVDAWLTKHETL